jgi:hypothetical protein
MPITSNIDQAKELTIFKVTGVLGFDKVLRVVRDFYDGDPTKHVLWDFIDTAEIQLTSVEVEAISNFRPRYEGKQASGKTAFVAQKDILYGLSRMFEIQSRFREAPFNIMVFRNTAEARQWFDAS